MLVAASADIVDHGAATFRNLAEIENPAENLVGVASAGSEGAITAAQLAVRPVNRAAEVLETVPGMVISQHSGEGKANQYYLRGFNLDHGFDFAQTIAGIPVNMPTHAHAQGYADSNFLIPELVSGVQFRKGPYYAENGDFSSAGSREHQLLQRPRSADRHAHRRLLRLRPLPRRGLAAGGRGNLLTAFEWERDNGPWVSPNNKDKYNGVLRYSQGDSRNGLSLTFLGFSNHWHSTDQIPQRAIDSGPDQPLRIHRGDRRRRDVSATAASFDWQRSGTNDSTRLTAYVQRYGVQLFHNFTYFLNDPVNGDQFEQFERALDDRRQADASAAVPHRREVTRRTPSASTCATIRSAARSASITTRATERLATVRADDADQVSVGMFADIGDRVEPHVPDDVRAARRRLSLERASPTIRSTPARRRPASSARRCRRRSGRGAAPSSTPTGDWASTPTRRWASRCRSTRSPASRPTPSPPFARAQGGEFGVRTVAVRGLQTTATVWYLGFDSELIYVGDSGSTEAGPASRRMGVEITNYIYPNPWMTMDLDMSFSRARFLDVPAGEDFVPGALNRVISGGRRGEPARRRQRRAVRQPPAAAFRTAAAARRQQRASRSRRRSSTARSATSSPSGFG